MRPRRTTGFVTILPPVGHSVPRLQYRPFHHRGCQRGRMQCAPTKAAAAQIPSIKNAVFKTVLTTLKRPTAINPNLRPVVTCLLSPPEGERLGERGGIAAAPTPHRRALSRMHDTPRFVRARHAVPLRRITVQLRCCTHAMIQATTHRWEVIGITSKLNIDYAISRSGKAGYTVRFTNMQHIAATGDCMAAVARG
jgi:hypothetical protein